MQWNCPIVNDTYRLKVAPLCDVSHLSITLRTVFIFLSSFVRVYMCCVLFCHTWSHSKVHAFFGVAFVVVTAFSCSNRVASVLAIDFLRKWSIIIWIPKFQCINQVAHRIILTISHCKNNIVNLTLCAEITMSNLQGIMF